jgi:PIN domain nuclease of toxin-antitoxin system
LRLLLDTQAWLWMIGKPERLSAGTRSLLASPQNDLLLSAASSWEIAIKHSRGRLPLPGEPSGYVPAMMERTGVRGLPVEHAHALAVASLPWHHRDPFDRLMVAQAMLERLTIVTADRVFARYDVEIIEAS